MKNVLSSLISKITRKDPHPSKWEEKKVENGVSLVSPLGNIWGANVATELTGVFESINNIYEINDTTYIHVNLLSGDESIVGVEGERIFTGPTIEDIIFDSDGYPIATIRQMASDPKVPNPKASYVRRVGDTLDLLFTNDDNQFILPGKIMQHKSEIYLQQTLWNKEHTRFSRILKQDGIQFGRDISLEGYRGQWNTMDLELDDIKFINFDGELQIVIRWFYGDPSLPHSSFVTLMKDNGTCLAYDDTSEPTELSHQSLDFIAKGKYALIITGDYTVHDESVQVYDNSYNRIAHFKEKGATSFETYGKYGDIDELCLSITYDNKLRFSIRDFEGNHLYKKTNEKLEFTAYSDKVELINKNLVRKFKVKYTESGLETDEIRSSDGTILAGGQDELLKGGIGNWRRMIGHKILTVNYNNGTSAQIRL